MKLSKSTRRIMDANFNRSREALRVCEDIVRFVFENEGLTRKLKNARLTIGAILKDSPDFSRHLIESRDALFDVGKRTMRLESKRGDIRDIFYANMERAKESLRVLEEFSKLQSVKMSERLKKLRFRVYRLEKEISDKL